MDPITYTLTFDQAAVNKIGAGLMKLPFEEVAPLIEAIRRDVQRIESEYRIAAEAKANASAAVARAADAVVADARAAKEAKPSRARRK